MRLATTVALFTCVAAVCAGQTPTSAPSGRALLVLTPAQIDPSRLLPPPPADGSPKQLSELDAVRQLVASRSASRLQQAMWDNEHENATLFAPTLGTAFDLTRLPATARLLETIENDQAIAASRAKEYFKRRLPAMIAMPSAYQAWTCDKTDRAPSTRSPRSYPSGHATLGYAVGGVLATLMPRHAQAILGRASDYAYSREVCGDHYQSDVEAGQVLGTALATMLLNAEALKPQLDAAQAELRAAFLDE